MSRRRRIIAGCVLGALAGFYAEARAAFSGMVIFGDSLSDVGNVYDQTFHFAPQSPPYFDGRYSNGPLWDEKLALNLSLPAPTPSRLGGRDYAYAGTKTGGGSTFIFPFSFPNIGAQINTYLSGNTPSPEQLFVVWGGGNDFIDGQSNPSIPVNNIVNHVTALANAGASQFLVPNLPPLGKVPRFRGTANEATMDARSLQFNTQLAPALNSLEASLDVQIWQLDVGGLFQELLSNPSAYGFTNVTQPALVGGNPVPNQDEYLFWDDIHPTRIAHALLGDIASDLLFTHTWASTQASGSWFDPENWDPSAVPTSQSIAHVINSNLTTTQTVLLNQNSTVQRVLVRGDAGSMRLIVQSGAVISASSIHIASQGQLDLQGAAVAATTVRAAPAGSITGNGTITADVINEGTVAPGPTGSALHIAGNYTQHANAMLMIELAGTSSSEIDRLDVTGTATLDGSLAIGLANNFIALPGQTFDVLSFGSRSGDLSIINFTEFAGLKFQKIYSASELTLSASALGGDANLDGAVNLLDFNVLAAHFGQSGQNWLSADFTADGVVNLSDFNVLASNFGQVVISSELTPHDWAELAGMVPEPGTAALSFALPVLLLRRTSSICR